MSYSITQFQNSPGPDQLSALDNNFVTLGAADTIACAIAGTNTLTLTPNAAGLVPSQTIAAYTNYMLFTGVASASNTGPVTAAVGSIGSLNVYKDTLSGPKLLNGFEIIQGCAISLRYDSSLNSGVGGFHLRSSTDNTNSQIGVTELTFSGIIAGSAVATSTITNLLSGNSPTLTFTATPGWSSQDQTFTLTALAAAAAFALPAPGDFIAVNPPSLGATGISYQGYVSALGSLSSTTSVATVNIRLINAASASLASNSGIYRWKAERFVP